VQDSKQKTLTLLILITLISFIFAFLAHYLYIKEDYISTDLNSLNALDNVEKEPIYKIAIFADSHINYSNLEASISIAKNFSVDAIFHLGDHSNVGSTIELKNTKDILDSSKIPYIVLPGDRDAGIDGDVPPPIGGVDFLNVFQKNICLFLHNPYNYTLLPDSYINDFNFLSKNAKFIFASQPLQSPGLNVFMGSNNINVNNQKDILLNNVRSLNNLDAIISGDAHFYSNDADKINPNLKHISIGAITDDINLQKPQFSLLYIYENSYKIIDTQL